MKYSKLTWYDLNEIWVCLHKEIDFLNKQPGESNYIKESRISNTKNVLRKIDSVMEALTTQETNQSDYELRIVSRVDNTVK